MSIQAEILRLQKAKNDLKTAIEKTGVIIPDTAKIDEYYNYIQVYNSNYNVFKDVKIQSEDWIEDSTYPDYWLRANIILENVTSSHFPIVVLEPRFSQDMGISTIADSYDGGIYLYSSSIPEEIINISTIICMKVL